MRIAAWSRSVVLALAASALCAAPVAHDPPPAAAHSPTFAASIAASGAVDFAPRGAARALRLETVALGRGDAPSVLARPRVRRDARGASIDRGGVRERLDLAADGVEQSWRFAARADGAGDLVVRVRATGFAHARATGDAVVFDDAARYAQATWIDADARRTPLRVAWSADAREIVLRVPAAVVDHARYPATLDPWLSPEFSLDATAGVDATDDTTPTVAFDGVNFFAVWATSPSSPTVSVRGARFDVTGRVLDAPALLIATAPAVYSQPAVAYGGGAYLVGWAGDDGLQGARVGVDGAVMAGAGFSIAARGTDGTVPRGVVIAHGASSFLVAYQRGQCSTGQPVEGVRVADTGAVLDATPITFDRSGCGPAVASNGNGWLVA